MKTGITLLFLIIAACLLCAFGPQQPMGGVTFQPAAGGGGAAFVAADSTYCNASSATCNFASVSVPAGNTLKVYILWGSATITLNSVTACGDTLTLLNNPTAIAANSTQAATGYVLSSTGGTCTIAATFSASTSAFIVYDINSGTTALDGNIIGVGTGATRTSGNVTTTAAGYCFGATANYNAATGVANSPWTQGENNTTNAAYSEYYVTPSGTNYSASFTQSPTWPTTSVAEVCFK